MRLATHRTAFLSALAAVLAAGYGVLTLAVHAGAVRAPDHAVAAFIWRLWWGVLTPLLDVIALAASVEVTGALAVLLALFLIWRRRWRETVALLALPLATAAEAVTKAAGHGWAGATSDVSAVVTTLDSSYPSGHVVRVVVLVGLLAVVVARTPDVVTCRGWVRRLLLLLAGAWIATVAFDRLYLGVHWLSDVLGGLLLGAAFLTGALLILGRSPRTAIP